LGRYSLKQNRALNFFNKEDNVYSYGIRFGIPNQFLWYTIKTSMESSY